MNRVTTVTDALGDTTVFGYDGSGNQQTVTDGLGHTTTTLYDALDRATTITTAVSGGTTTITYDAAGRETSLTDPVGNKTQWAYDANDRLTTLTQPNNYTVTYVYDSGGELIDTTDADGRRTTFSYDSGGDQTGETWVGAAPSETITYTYNADRELTGAADGFATLTFTYDSGGNEITAATSGPGTGQPSVTLTSGYNAQQRLTSVTDNLSSVGMTTYVYDAGQRLTTITTSYGGTAGPQIVTSYAPNDQISSQTRTIGGSGTQVNTTYQYDAADRQTTITDYVSGGSALATYVYSYDKANRVTTMVDAEGTYTYTYDNANELTNVDKGGTQVESYAYDSNGNRTGTSYSTTVMNETLTSPGVTYTYDHAGNMVSANSGGTITTYTYDFHNRLTGVTQGGTVVATYVYNALDQRISFQESGGRTWTIYNGKSADALPYADFNSSGTLLTRYVSGPGMVNGAAVDELLARTSSGGSTAWYLTDKLDSVRDIVGSSGSELDHIVYDSFGNVVTETNASNGDRFKFAGMEYDSVTGQYYDRARWYTSVLGRFATQDPLGLSAGSANEYDYVSGAPTNSVDPSGELQLPPVGPPSDPNLPGLGQDLNPAKLTGVGIDYYPGRGLPIVLPTHSWTPEPPSIPDVKTLLNVQGPYFKDIRARGVLMFDATGSGTQRVRETGAGIYFDTRSGTVQVGKMIYGPFILVGPDGQLINAGIDWSNLPAVPKYWVLIATIHMHPLVPGTTVLPSPADSPLDPTNSTLPVSPFRRPVPWIVVAPDPNNPGKLVGYWIGPPSPGGKPVRDPTGKPVTTGPIPW